MAEIQRIREARRTAQESATRRWNAREKARLENLRDVDARGIGAADSPQRNARFTVRKAELSRARELWRAGLLPTAIERKIGPTLDYTPYAPSNSARLAGRPVARLVALGGPGVQPEGFATGFLVTGRLLLTNHHVFPTRADARGAGANFLYEQSDRGLLLGEIFEVDAGEFYASDEYLDYALVAVKPRSIEGGAALADFGAIALIEATPKILIGQRVPIIQHPDGGPKQYAVAQNRLVDILDEGFLHYETDTQRGSSGAPAFSEDWQLVALHHTAIPEVRDGKVVATDGRPWNEEMGDDRVHWVANEGTRVSSLVKHLSGLRPQSPAERALLDELLASTTDPVDDLARAGAGALGAELVGGAGSMKVHTDGGDPMPYNLFQFTGPVTINVQQPPSLPAATPIATPIAATVSAAPEKKIRFDPNYELREGYDPAFLDPNLLVPVPRVADERQRELLRDAEGAPIVLKYHHFELVMNEKRRLQMWSAANVDYSPGKKSSRGRNAFGTDRWIPDPRIPARAQIFDEDFYRPAGKIDRGHVVRREDNAWGENETEIEFANSDTFHWPNCTPQHEAFNQSAPSRDPQYAGMKGVWGDFENHIQASLTEGPPRACVLAGPVLDDENDPSADFGRGAIKYPLRFWKVVVVATPAAAGERALRAFGFVFSQKPVVDRFGIEVFGPGKFQRWQTSLRRISDLTGVLFDDALHRADARRDDAEEVLLRSPDEIVGLRRAEAPAR